MPSLLRQVRRSPKGFSHVLPVLRRRKLIGPILQHVRGRHRQGQCPRWPPLPVGDPTHPVLGARGAGKIVTSARPRHRTGIESRGRPAPRSFRVELSEPAPSSSASGADAIEVSGRGARDRGLVIERLPRRPRHPDAGALAHRLVGAAVVLLGLGAGAMYAVLLLSASSPAGPRSSATAGGFRSRAEPARRDGHTLPAGLDAPGSIRCFRWGTSSAPPTENSSPSANALPRGGCAKLRATAVCCVGGRGPGSPHARCSTVRAAQPPTRAAIRCSQAQLNRRAAAAQTSARPRPALARQARIRR